MLEIQNVTKIYDNTVLALDKVSFSVPKGQFLAVVGLSGSGKSTLLRCINRLIEPTSGQIIWNTDGPCRALPPRPPAKYRVPRFCPSVRSWT